MENVLTSWKQLHASNYIPFHTLFNVHLKLLCRMGRESEIPHLQEEYLKLLNGQEDLAMFSALTQANLLLMRHAYAEAIPIFEQICSFSM